MEVVVEYLASVHKLHTQNCSPGITIDLAFVFITYHDILKESI